MTEIRKPNAPCPYDRMHMQGYFKNKMTILKKFTTAQYALIYFILLGNINTAKVQIKIHALTYVKKVFRPSNVDGSFVRQLNSVYFKIRWLGVSQKSEN